MRQHSSNTSSRRLRLGGLTVLVMALVVGQAVPAIGEPASRSTQPVFRIADVFAGTPVPVGSTTVVRNSNGVSAQVSTTDLEPGDVVTLWWIVFNDPSECQAGIPGATRCGPGDHLAGRGGFSALYGAGRIVAADGSARYGTHARAGDASRALEGPGLLNPRDAEIILIMKTHGPAIPGLVSEQLHTFAGGCADQSDVPPEAPADLVGALGPNDCDEVHLSVHSPGS